MLLECNTRQLVVICFLIPVHTLRQLYYVSHRFAARKYFINSQMKDKTNCAELPKRSKDVIGGSQSIQKI